MNFENSGKQITKDEIKQIEQELGIKIPDSLVEHYLKHNGGIPEKPFFYYEETDNEIEVQLFSPIKHKLDGRTVEEKYRLFKEKSDFMCNYLTFANDYGANQICVDLNSGKVCIIYLDMGEIKDECMAFLANDFNGFISGLSENSIDDEDE